MKRTTSKRRDVVPSKRISALALWVVVVFAMASVVGAQRATAQGRSFFDDFSDMDVSNWGSEEAVIRDATSGDLIVTSAPPNGAAWPPLSGGFDADISIQTQVRLIEGELGGGTEEGLGLFARFSGGMGYVAVITPDGEIAITLSLTDLPSEDVVLASMMTGLDVFSTDIHLQFDLFGDTLSLTAWAEGTPRPVIPQLRVVDTSQPLSGTPGLLGPRTSASRSAFRFWRAGPRRPVNLSDTTGRNIGIHVVANDCAAPTFASVAPELTDPNIDNFGGGGRDHRAYYSPHAPERDELHVFLPGTDAGPGYANAFMQQAASHGTKTIGLQYVNGPKHDYELCWADWFANAPRDTNCMEKVLIERTYGDDVSPLVFVNQPNSMVSRLVKLLEYLDVEQPERGWGQYLDGGAPDWGRIVFSGHSQGSSVSALLARDHELMRAVMLGGPYQVTPTFKAASFLVDPRATALERQFGFRHVDDEPFLHALLWHAMGLIGPPVFVENSSPPYEGSHYLMTDIDVSLAAAHGSVITNSLREPDGTPIFKDVWLYMLGIEPGTPCGGEAVYASNVNAAFVEVPGGAALTFDRSNDQAVITIPGPAWALVLAEDLGGCSVAGSDGLICDSVSDYTIAIDLSDGLAVSAQSYWTAQLVAGGSTLDVLAREPDVAADGFFYQEVAGQTIAVACSTAESIPSGECLPTDLRPPDAYDPRTETFTYLGVVDAFADPIYGLSRFALEELPALPTEIDIRPRRDSNSIYPFSHFIFSVAILGSDTFDVADVDVTTLAFGPSGAAPAFGLTNFWVALFAYRDVNDDNVTDLRVHFRTNETDIAMGDPEACLTGETLDGTYFKGCDDITTKLHCGRGFEAAFVFLPLVLLRRRRGRRRKGASIEA